MKSRVLFVLLVLGLVGGALIYYVPRRAAETAPVLKRRRHPIPPPPPAVVVEPVQLPTVTPAEIRITPPQPNVAARRVPTESQVIPIQDHTTHDFSYGGPPILRSGANDSDAIDRALREMTEATKDLVIGPDGKIQRTGKK